MSDDEDDRDYKNRIPGGAASSRKYGGNRSSRPNSPGKDSNESLGYNPNMRYGGNKDNRFN